MNDAFDLASLPAAVPAKLNGAAQDIHQIEAIRLASDILDRAKFGAKAGLTFGGKRDLYEALGYPRILTPLDYRGKYTRGGIAARIVEAFPKATWRGGAELVEDEDPEIITDFEDQWDLLNKRLNIWDTLYRTDVLAGLGTFSVLLIGAPGNMNEELKLNGPQDILYLLPYGEDETTIQSYETDPTNPRFGQPIFYQITRKTTLNVSLVRSVHWSRVIHVADGILDDPIHGTPRLEKVWNYLDDLEKVVGGGSEAFWLRVFKGLIFSVDPDMKFEEGELKKFKDQAEEFGHKLRRTMAARGFDVKDLGSDVANFNNQVTALISLISGASEIPQRLLLGSERGELASSQDKENWNVRVQDRRDGFANRTTRSLVDRISQFGGIEAPEDYEIRWPELDDLNDIERADVAGKLAGLNSTMGETVITGAEIRDKILQWDPLDEEQLAEIQSKKDEEAARKTEELKLKIKQPVIVPGSPKAAGLFKRIKRMLGGPGSGNFGHGGRPGEVGGSGDNGSVTKTHDTVTTLPKLSGKVVTIKTPDGAKYQGRIQGRVKGTRVSIVPNDPDIGNHDAIITSVQSRTYTREFDNTKITDWILLAKEEED